MTWKPGKVRGPSPGGPAPSTSVGLPAPQGPPGAWIPRSYLDEEPFPSDPCAFSSPRLCKIPEFKQHSRSSWDQSGAVSTDIEIQLTLPSKKAPALPPLPPSHQPSTWTPGPLAVPSARPTSGRTARSHALQPSFLWSPEGAGQEAGEPRPPRLFSTAPSSAERSALEPESKGETTPGAPAPPRDLGLWALPPLGVPPSSRQMHFHSLWPSVSNQPATEYLCLSVCPSHTQTNKE